jgi:hypothetical protein
MSLKSKTRDPSLKSLPEDLCSGFFRPEKIDRPQPDLNPRILDLEASTLTRDHWGRPTTPYSHSFWARIFFSGLLKLWKEYYLFPLWLHVMPSKFSRFILNIHYYVNGTKYKTLHCGVFSTPHYRPFSAQTMCLRILFSGNSCFNCVYDLSTTIL